MNGRERRAYYKKLMPGFSGSKMTNFKKVITEAAFGIKDGFSISIKVGNRDHIHDIQPREFNGVNLFDKYHGRQSCEAAVLVAEAHTLWQKSQEPMDVRNA